MIKYNNKIEEKDSLSIRNYFFIQDNREIIVIYL